MKKHLSMDEIQEIKELYLPTCEKHKRIVDALLYFQKEKLNISAHYRKVLPLDTPCDSGKEYSLQNNICGVWEYAFILMNIPLQRGLTVLEAASSASILPAYLVSLGFDVISTDLDTSYQQEIRKQSGFEYRIIQANLSNIPLSDSSVDVIVSNSALEHIADDCSMWREFTRVLNRGGLMVHTFPTAKPGYRSAWFQEPVDFFANPTPIHDRTHRLIDKRIAEERYFGPNNLWCEIWEEHFYLREIQAYCVVRKM